MLKSLTTAASGMAAQQTNIDVTANNMANVNTVGFRRSRAEFQDLLYQTVRAPGGQAGDGATLPTGLQVGTGVRTVSTEQVHMQGSLMQTGNPLDLAIEGDGFFQVTRPPNGDLIYTRAGNLKADADGRLVTVDGYTIEPAILIPPDATSVTVSQQGVVSITIAGENESQEIGQLELAAFANPSGLQVLGRSLYAPTAASGQPIVAQPGQDNG